MGRNGNGEGSIRQRPDGRWGARYHDANGKRRSVYGKSRQDAANRLATKIASEGTEPVEQPDDSNIKVRDFFAEYLQAIRDGIERRSYETSKDVVRLHLNPEFGSKRLGNLDRRSIQAMYSRKRDDGLSPARVKRIHDVLAASLNAAVKWDYISKNPCDAVTKPRMPAPEIRPLSKDAAKRYIAVASGERYEACKTC